MARAQRQRYLAASAPLAEQVYSTHPELANFEAFREEDFDDDAQASEAG